VSVTPTSAAAAYERPEPPFPSQVVEEVLRVLLRAARAQQLYLRNNPMYVKAVEQLQLAFAGLWAHADEITLVVSETTLVWEGEVVLEEREKAGDSLPWTCYKDGVRSLQFSRGFEQAEVVEFLDLLHRVRRAAPEEDDLLTLLWQGDFVYLRYAYVDLGVDGAGGFETGASQGESGGAGRGLAAAAAEPQVPGMVSIDDFDSAARSRASTGVTCARTSSRFSSTRSRRSTTWRCARRSPRSSTRCSCTCSRRASSARSPTC
jgi:hypothetical protein